MPQENPQDVRDESRAERDDRNLAELLQELRVAGLGVQVLFGFLLPSENVMQFVGPLLAVLAMFGGLWFAFPLTRRR